MFMSFEDRSKNISSEQNPVNKKRKIVIADVGIEDQARDIAEEKMTASKGELRGIKGFIKKIWKHNLAHEYYRQKEIAKARREIQQAGNLYAGENGEKNDHDGAMKAIIDRFAMEYDADGALRKGEEKKTLKEENPEEKTTKNIIKDLVKRYAIDNLTDEQFNFEKNNLFEKELDGIKGGKNKKLAQKGSLYADNLLEVAKQIKNDIAHGKGLDALDLDFDVVVGKARAGVETQAQYNAVDKIIERIQGSKLEKIGRFVNETTLASVVALAYGFGVKGTISATQRAAKWVGPLGLGLSAGIGGAVAGARENKRFKEERAQHIREMAKGKGMEAGSKRREEMEKFRYETKNATDLTDDLEKSLKDMIDNPGKDKLEKVLADINEIDSRISFSEREKIDLISFSDAKKVEQERTRMYVSTAEAKVFLKKNIGKDWAALYKDESELKDYLSQIKETKIQEDFKKEKELKDQIFNKMKLKKVAWAVTKGLGVGVGVGLAAQEIFAGNSQEGIFNSKDLHNSDQVRRFTSLEYLRRYISGELPQADADYMQQAVGQHIGGAEQITRVDTVNYVKNHEDLFSKIKRVHWADNDSLRPDKNELKMWWGGEKGTGLDSDGNYVFNVKNMAPGGSFHGNENWNPQELMKEGKMKVLISLSKDTQNQVMEIPIDADGNAVIDPNSEIGKLAFENVNGHAKFIGKFAEVAVIGENKGGVDYVDILATHKGKGIDNITEVIKNQGSNIETALPGKPADYDVDWPYAIPIVGRRPMEKLGKKAEASVVTPPSTEQLPLQQPEKKRENELKRVESFIYLLSAVELAALARKKEATGKGQKEELASLLKALEKTKKPKILSSAKPTKEQIEKMEKARAAAWHTIYKLANFEELNADTPVEGDQKFLDLTRKLWTEITVHGFLKKDATTGKEEVERRSDLDGNSCLKLMELAGIHVDMDKVNFVQQGETVESGIIMDTSERHGVIAEEDGRRVIFDHHSKESDRSTSATKFVYETLVELGLLDKKQQVDLDKYVEFVTKYDNLDFAPDEKAIYSNYYENLYGLAGKMKVEDVLELIKQGIDPKASLLADYLKKHTYFNPAINGVEPLSEYAKRLKEQMGYGKMETEKMEKKGFVLDTGDDRFGKVLIDTMKKIGKDKWQNKVNGIDSSKQVTAFAKGYGAYVVWSPDEKKFYVYTKNRMDDKSIPGGFSDGKNIRGHMLICGAGRTEPVKPEFLQEILGKLSGKADFKIEGRLKKVLDVDRKSKDMLDLLDEGKLTEDVLRKTARDVNVPLRTFLTEIMIQRNEKNGINKEFLAKIKTVPNNKDKTAAENKIGIEILMEYQKKKNSNNGQEKQKNMAESVKKLSDLFLNFELSYDMIKDEAKRIKVAPAELAEDFIQNNKELNSQFEARKGSMEAEKLAIAVILESEKKSIKEEIKKQDEKIDKKNQEIIKSIDDREKQRLELEKVDMENNREKIEEKKVKVLVDIMKYL